MEKRTIWVGPNEDHIMIQSGLIWTNELRENASEEGSPSSLKSDWLTIASWIGWDEGDLTGAQNAKIKEAWTAYFLRGVAPSLNLTKSFKFISEELSSRKQDIISPPPEVFDVFDRLMATDEQIAAKRDAIREANISLAKLNFNHPKPADNLWRDLTPKTRKWLFACAVWSIGIAIYAYVFDPFDVGGWAEYDDEEWSKLIVLVLLPFAGGLLYQAYEKWIR